MYYLKNILYICHMKTLVNKLKRSIHIHSYRPIVSKYVSFNSRDIIYECSKCYHKEHQTVTNHFGDPFPIPTNNLLTDKEFNDILKSDKKYVKEIWH